jgi:photosystem II stability/assembly factor-like uncharacterized protein
VALLLDNDRPDLSPVGMTIPPRKSLCVLAFCAIVGTSWMRAADPAAIDKGQWTPIHEGTGGVTVDRTNGDVYLVVTGKEIFKEKGQGIWKSSDRGSTFSRADGEVVGGRCETGYALCSDPNGKRHFCFMLDGPSGYTLDGGKTWEKIAKVNRGWDFAAVDWSAAIPQTIFGFEHENGGKLHLSEDAGKSWRKLGEFPMDRTGRTFGVGVVEANTLVRWSGTAAGIERSADRGATWTKVSDEMPSGHVMVVFKEACYWVGQKGLLVSKDKGVTWAWQGQPVPAAWGPYFGKDENHIVVAAKGGLQETTDGGQTWSLVAPLPEMFKNPPGPGWFLNLAFDPVNNVFYASWMGKPAYRFQR